MTEYQKKITYLEVVRQTFWEGKTIFCHTNSCQDFYERKKLQATLVLIFYLQNTFFATFSINLDSISELSQKN